MIKSDKIKLNVEELVAVLSLCGYERVASDILNEQNLITNETEFDRFVQEAESSLKQKGYWDDNRDSKLESGLEDLIYLLVHSKKKIRCVQMKKRSVLLIHSVNKGNSLLQEIHGGEHSFSFYENKQGFYDILRGHYRMEDSEINVGDKQPIEMTDNLVDDLHTSEPGVVLAMTEDKKQPQALRDFGKDLLNNSQEFDNISFMHSNYVKDQSEFDNIAFLLPGDDFIWHMDYSNVGTEHKVVMEPIPTRSYFQEIERVAINFFNA